MLVIKALWIITTTPLNGLASLKREDKQKQIDQWALNYQAFGAPVVLLKNDGRASMA